MLHENDWSHTLHDRWPTPAFLSILAVTDFSWLQKRHGKVVARGSFFFLVGAFAAFFRLPCIKSQSEIRLDGYDYKQQLQMHVGQSAERGREGS